MKALERMETVSGSCYPGPNPSMILCPPFPKAPLCLFPRAVSQSITSIRHEHSNHLGLLVFLSFTKPRVSKASSRDLLSKQITGDQIAGDSHTQESLRVTPFANT